MSGMKEVLKDAVLLVLPSLSPDVTNQLVEKLMDQGVEGLDDLVYVKEDDILEFIRPIQCRKLLSSWKNQGQSLSNQRWMLSLEGQVVCEGAQPNFITGLAALFASFYNFNLQYQEEAACTLEFVQRRFVDINPERGSKAKKGKVTSKKTGQVVQKKNATVSPPVSSLLRKLADFEWNFV
ncbi:uncharacterized protein LOC113110151 isoform X2 [Carassius auratus]|uniref:Uncharacterized protein LOC113110151 isoform X2 n=1 Tax=Carassius auratus TaxID=7957 RepID=A0A6P6Q9V2_CARAU|nr:uncharacterized protein LOC113110151 isoform X2 [Carassius auratus]